MKDVAKKFFYLFLTIIFQTISISTTRLYLTLFNDHKSHPYIITGVYFISYLFFIVIFYFSLPNKRKKDLLESENIFRKRANSIKLYKKNSIITIEEDKKYNKNKQKNESSCPHVYCVKNEVIYPSILLSIGQGINIYTLGKIDLTLYLMINGSILICLFRIMKSKGIKKIKLNKIISAVLGIISILIFIIYNLCVSDLKVSYLFFISFTFFASIMISFAKYFNFKTLHRYNIDFISSNITIGDETENKEVILIENSDENTGANKKIGLINSINIVDDKEDNISTGSSSNENDNNDDNNSPIEAIFKKNKKKRKNLYFSYEKIIFYEGVLCFCFWMIIIFISSFIKCPENSNSIFKIFLCNNCTTMSGYETFFNSKELIIFNKVQYKNEIIKYLYNYPICTIIFIIIIIITEFFYQFSFEKIFQGKYKTKLILVLNPIVSLIIFGIEYLGKKYSADSFLNQILPNKINISEQILCLALFLTSIVSYLRIFNFKCKR